MKLEELKNQLPAWKESNAEFYDNFCKLSAYTFCRIVECTWLMIGMSVSLVISLGYCGYRKWL